MINDVIEVKIGVYLQKTQTNLVNNNKEHAELIVEIKFQN